MIEEPQWVVGMEVAVVRPMMPPHKATITKVNVRKGVTTSVLVGSDKYSPGGFSRERYAQGQIEPWTARHALANERARLLMRIRDVFNGEPAVLARVPLSELTAFVSTLDAAKLLVQKGVSG